MDEPQSWDPTARAAYATAVERVRVALDRHAAAIDDSTDMTELAPSATELESALAALSETEHALTGAAAFWLDLDDDPDDADDPDHIDDREDDPEGVWAGSAPADGPVPVAAELHLSMDVTDPQQLLGGARELDPTASVTSLEDAIFVITGRLGWDELLADQVDGITMQGATARLDTP